MVKTCLSQKSLSFLVNASPFYSFLPPQKLVLSISKVFFLSVTKIISFYAFKKEKVSGKNQNFVPLAIRKSSLNRKRNEI